MPKVKKVNIIKALFIVILCVSLAALIFYFQVNSAKKISHGQLINPLALDRFLLTTHKNVPFSKQDLLGKWHILAYGYTYCPSICPMTVTTLVQLASLIEQEGKYTDVDLLFYSVDPNRDSSEQLAQYLAFFDADITGLRKGKDNSYLKFEENLAIKVELDTNGSESYMVSHGLIMYLINPKAELQAVFQPQENQSGQLTFNRQDLLQDYQNIRSQYD